MANLTDDLGEQLTALREAGLYRELRRVEGAAGPRITIDGRDYLNLASNNYLGLANHPAVVESGIRALQKYGAGTASVRFICGTFEIQQELERSLADWVGTESALTYPSCWMANEGLFAVIAGEESVIISDELNHASIIDACRLSKAKRLVYRHADLKDLQQKLSENRAAKRKIVVTDGVFSMEGDLPPLPDLVTLCEKENAILVVDDSHGTGVLGKTGRGIAEHFGVFGKIDIITSTLGKALGGAAGGFVAGSTPLIDFLQQKSRTQLFSNALPPTIAGSAHEALKQLKAHPEWVKYLQEVTHWFRIYLRKNGLNPLEGESAIVPIILGDTARAIPSWTLSSL